MIGRVRFSNFRCLGSVDVELSPDFNLVTGPNASGKTSFLEALAYLGRGKSFRGATTQNLVKHGESEFVLFGEVFDGGRDVPVGVRNGKEGLEIRVDGETAQGSAALAEALPLQIIDPDVHNLIAGGPDLRRKFLDWVAFHVEHEHLSVWRRFRRALKQRNAALKAKQGRKAIAGWNAEFVELGVALDASRRAVLDATIDALTEHGDALLGTALAFEYQQGWAKDKDLAAALEEGMERDIQLGATQLGPHRADIRIAYDERQARKLVSRGQQKLLASAMILAAAETVQACIERPLLLLLDDPAAELDRDAVDRLMAAVSTLGCQVVATSLDPTALRYPSEPRMFHVEHGELTTAEH